jgi:hypothetical protein
MSSGRPTNKALAEANLRALLGATTTERWTDACARIVAERDRLLLKVADLEAALRAHWEARDAAE